MPQPQAGARSGRGDFLVLDVCLCLAQQGHPAGGLSGAPGAQSLNPPSVVWVPGPESDKGRWTGSVGTWVGPLPGGCPGQNWSWRDTWQTDAAKPPPALAVGAPGCKGSECPRRRRGDAAGGGRSPRPLGWLPWCSGTHALSLAQLQTTGGPVPSGIQLESGSEFKEHRLRPHRDTPRAGWAASGFRPPSRHQAFAAHFSNWVNFPLKFIMTFHFSRNIGRTMATKASNAV